MIKTILIDDDASNLKTLSGLIGDYCPSLTIVATCSSIKEAKMAIDKHEPELVFLDVELKGELGFDLFSLYPSPSFEVVFTTAHEKYALRAIKSSCLEYILKPIDYRELVSAVLKFEKQKREGFNSKKIEVLLENVNGANPTMNKIAIPSADGYVFINTSEILYCEADLNYTKVFTVKGDNFLSTKNLKEFEDLLDATVFFRCHKSWLISLNHVKKYSRTDGTRVQMVNDQWIDISVRKREEFLNLFNKNHK